MKVRDGVPISYKAAASVADVARMVGLSRERFYQLVRIGFFPQPLYDLFTRRPLYLAEQQRLCVEARRANVGVNGQVVMFYVRGPSPTKAMKKSPVFSSVVNEGAVPKWLLDGVRGLGLMTVTEVEIGAAFKQSFPSGVDEGAQGTAIRDMFLLLRKRQNRADSVGG